MPNEESVPLGKMFALLTKWYVGAISAKLIDLPIERHFYVLKVIDDLNGAITQKELAEMVWTDKASMVRILDYLTEHGMIERVQDPNDRRAYRLQSTELAKSYMPRIQAAFLEVNRSALESLPENEVARVFPILEKMACNLSKLPSEQVFLHIQRMKEQTEAL
jgi:DNA-binding MarR family transcriptional regulator